MLNFKTHKHIEEADKLGIAVCFYDETLDGYIEREAVEEAEEDQFIDLNEIEEVCNEAEEVTEIIIYIASSDDSIGGGAFENESDYWRYILG